VAKGARKKKVCDFLGISIRTCQRWQKNGVEDSRKGSKKCVPRKLSDSERQEILDTVNDPAYRDYNPHQIVPVLAQKGIYLASESTIYRILKESNQLHHRSNNKPAKKKAKPPELVATAPNQVWCWDITWLPTVVRGIFLFAYMIIDIFDKSIVGWEIHDREDSELAKQMFRRISGKMNLRGISLHSDNGNPMKGFALLSMLYYLGVMPSFSRPRVSNDNPYIESFFKTVKYTPGYPGQFRDIEHAREWMSNFVDWYNTKHLHSSLGYVTPDVYRKGIHHEIFRKRNATMEKAREKNPERWGSRDTRIWQSNNQVILNSIDERKLA
jgi:putative transposase